MFVTLRAHSKPAFLQELSLHERNKRINMCVSIQKIENVRFLEFSL